MKRMTTNSALLFALRPLEISPKVRQYPSRSSRNLAQALAELHLSPKAKASSTDNLALQKIAPLIHEIRGERVIPRCLIIKSTRKVNRCLINKSTGKEVAAERRSVPRSGGGWQAKVFGFGFLHLVYGS